MKFVANRGVRGDHVGDMLADDSRDRLSQASSCLAELEGVENLVTEPTPDAVPVAGRARRQGVKQVVNALR